MRALALTLLLALAGCQLQPADSHTMRQEVRATQSARFNAMIAADVETLDAILADGLVYTHTTGRVETKAEFLESLKSGTVSYDKVEIIDNAIRIAGDVASSTGAAEMSVSTPTRSMSFAIRFVEVYVRNGEGWQLIAWQSTRIPTEE